MNDEHDNAITDKEKLAELDEEDRAALIWANTRYNKQRSMNFAAKKAFLAGVEWQKGRHRINAEGARIRSRLEHDLYRRRKGRRSQSRMVPSAWRAILATTVDLLERGTMATWIMQYRTRESPGREWGEWKNLTPSLTFSDYYHPKYFEFRAMQMPQFEPQFVFDGLFTTDPMK